MARGKEAINMTLTQDEVEAIKKYRVRQAEKIFEEKVAVLAEARATENPEYQAMVTEYNRLGEELDAWDLKFKEECREELKPAEVKGRPATS